MQSRILRGRAFSGQRIAILAFAGISLFEALSPGATRAGDRREVNPMAPDLIAAIRDADAQAVRKLIEKGAGVNARDAESNTPLILASFYASPDCVRLLLEKGADVNAANKAGVTALIRAATDYEKARLLVDAGAKVGVRTADLGNTPLILAARRAGNARTVKLLLDHGADAWERNSAGVSPIISGAASGDLEIVRTLLDAGADADDFPRSNDPRAAALAAGFRTPLMWAAYQNDERMVRLLLEHGADPNRSTYFGSPLSQACWHDGFEAAAVLIDRGASVNARDAVGFTALHWAAGEESLRPHLVKLLLGSGADPNAAGGEPVGALGLVPQTPRLIAEQRGRTAIVNALVAAGAGDVPPREPIVTPQSHAPGRARDFDIDRVGREGDGGAANDRGPVARGVPAARQQAGLRLVPPAVLADGGRRPRPPSIHPLRSGCCRGTDRPAHQTPELLDRARARRPNPLPSGPGPYLRLRAVRLRRRRVPPSAMTDVQIHHLVTIQLRGRPMDE